MRLYRSRHFTGTWPRTLMLLQSSSGRVKKAENSVLVCVVEIRLSAFIYLKNVITLIFAPRTEWTGHFRVERIPILMGKVRVLRIIIRVENEPFSSSSWETNSRLHSVECSAFQLTIADTTMIKVFVHRLFVMTYEVVIKKPRFTTRSIVHERGSSTFIYHKSSTKKVRSIVC